MWYELPKSDFASNQNIGALGKIFDSFRPQVIIFQDSYAPIEQTLFPAIDALATKKPLLLIVEHNMPKVPIQKGLISLSEGVLVFARRILGRLLCPIRYFRSFLYERNRRRILYHRADKYLFLSERYKVVSNRIAGIDGGAKLMAMPNPVISESALEGLEIKRKEVLYCGSLISSKGVHRLVDIWAQLEKDSPDWVFTVVGDGNERGQLEWQVAKLGLRNIRFEGFQRNPNEYYRRAAIIVMASSFEGWPMVLGEAMSCRCVPVVYGSFLAAHDIIEDGQNGFIICPFDRNAFVRKLKDLMDNDDLRCKMADEASKSASKYDIGVIKERWYEVFKN